MPTADRSDQKGATPASDTDDLEKALGAAAEAGADTQGDTIAADDAGASKMSLEMDRKRKMPTSHPPGEGDD